MRHLNQVLWLLMGLLLPARLGAQPTAPPPGTQPLTLPQCLLFALQHQPAVRQARIDESIGERNIRLGLAEWLPQLRGTGAYTRNIRLPVAVLPNFADPSAPAQVRRIGLNNTSNLGLELNQTLFSNDVLRAARAGRYIRLQASQNTTSTQIDVVTDVSKAFYDILLTGEQLRVLDEAIRRQQRQHQDARAQYEAGLVDKTDYKRASIALNNAVTERKATAELLKGKYAVLRQLMGLPSESPLSLTYDTLQLVRETQLDTLEPLAFERRIELQQLQTQQQLQRLDIDYFRFGFLPSLGGFATYNKVYQNNNFSELYNRAFPTSQAGLQLALPLFTGTRRLQNLRIAELRNDRLELAILSTRNQINAEYQQALAAYKGALADLNAQQTNRQDAREIYTIIRLQYREGIKTYLEVIVAENDLRTAQLNYFNALYNVLAAKLDVQRAMGTVPLTF
ncbi:TolC family protein [Hymenobacter weizhouensis]|uniref:TolC family protein n=1 Tax=Hymenobacter sp. YIM 151500-1 TaxID=2987689 RepID=UPI002227504B|nr:TolC family protein [Hymenobacter sp. YIM 151500-1]UYZ61497.1 TolC family protein [Hymenobacter sp. YIM 151500-1]